MAPPVLSPSDTVLHSITNPSLATPDLPTRLARLLGLPLPPPSSSLPPPSSKPTSSRTIKPAAPSTLSRSTKAKPAVAPPESEPALKDSEAHKLAMKVVNGSLQAFTSLGQTQWNPSSSTPSSTTKPESTPNPFASPPPTLPNVLAMVACAHLALAKLRARGGKEGRADKSVERAAVSLVARLNAVGLTEASLEFLTHSYPHLLTLYEHDPLPTPPPTTSSTVVRKKAVAPVRATPSGSTSSRSTASSKAQPPTKESSSSSSLLRLLWLPTPTEDLEESVAGVLVGWALGSLVAVGRSLSAKEGGLEHLLTSLSSPLSIHSFHLTHLLLLPPTSLPPILLPAIRLLSNLPLTPLTSSTSPRTLFDLRSLSLELLLRLPALQPKLLWEQALRSCQIYLRAGQGTREFERVNEQLTGLVREVEGRETGEGVGLLEGKDWIKVAELWIKIATKLDDLNTLDKVTRLLDLPPSTPQRVKKSSSSSQPVEEPELDSEVVVARTTAALMQASTSIELFLGPKGSKTAASSTKLSHDLSNVTTRLASFSHSLAHLPSPSEVLIKTFKAMEKARRSCLALVAGREGGEAAEVGKELKDRSREVLEGLVGLVEELSFEEQIDPTSPTSNVLANLCTSSIDTLLALCRTDSPSSPPFKTPSPGIPHLHRAVALRTKFRQILVAPSSNTGASSLEIDFANLARCISGSAYNCAGAIYKAGYGAEAIEFLVMACEVGEQALKEVGEGGDQAGEEVWKALREGLSKRWELLASCWSKSGDKVQSHSSLLSSILSLPSSVFNLLSTLSSKESLSEVFLHPDLIQLAALVARVTTVAVSDLSLPPSLFPTLSAAKMDGAAMGAILEQQIVVLEGMGAGAAVGEASSKVIEDALVVYGEEEFPVRRIRLLARAVQQSCLQSSSSGSALHVSVEREVVSLCERQSFAQDTHLTPFLPQYRGLTHLWLAVEAHCFSSGSSSQPLLRHASESAKSFRSALSPVQADLRSSVDQKGGKGPLVVTNRQPKERVVGPTATTTRRPVRGGAAAAVVVEKPTTTAVKGRVARTLATKVAKGAKSSVVAPAPVATLSSSTSSSKLSSSHFDDLGLFLSHLDSFTSLLGLLGHSLARIEQLKIIRSLTRSDSSRIEVFLSASASLGSEYVKLSKSSRAAGIFTSSSTIFGKAPVDSVSPASRADFLLRYSDFLAHEGKVEQSITIYQEALTQSNLIIDAVTSRSAAKIRERSLKLERAAVALMVAASIHRARDDFCSSVASLSQAHRLWTRAIGNVSRLSPTTPEDSPALKTTSSNPFEVAKVAPEDAVAADDLATPKTKSSTASKGRRFDGMMWRTSRGLLDCLFALSETSSRRGTARDTEFFLQEALDLARSTNSTVLASRALAGRGLLSLLLGKEDECDAFVLQGRAAGDMIGERNIAELAALEGQLHLRSRRHLDALESFEIGIAALRAFDAAFEIEELRLPSSRASLGETGVVEPVLLPLLAQLLRCKASILRETASFDPSSLRSVSDQLARLPSTTETRSDDHSYNATVALRLALDEFKADLTMSSLTESTISMPMGSSSGTSAALSKARKDVKATLARAESAFDKTLASDAACGRVQRIREACMSLSLLRAFQTSLGQSSSSLTSKTAWALDHSSAITLSRELVEIVASKFKDSAPDDLVWPDLEQPSSSSSSSTPAHLPNGDSSSRHSSMRSYWSSVRERHLSEAIYSTKGTTEMPPNWSVVTINVTDDQSTLFISRHRHGSEPLVFCLPLDRQGRRDGDDETFTFLNAKEELEEIISMSNDGAKNAKGVEGKEGRAAWWAERRDLDKRMEELLQNIEFCWLGAFKTILNRPSPHSTESFSLFRAKMEKLFTRVLSSDQDRRKLLKIHLDDNLLECFSSLSPLCRDEELEDLVYFVLDLYQVHGVPVALAEIDIDELVTDLRSVLEDSERDRPKASSGDEDEHHTFLILDRHVQSIPWESLPSLRGRSISRIPSLAFLADRIALSKHLLSSSASSSSPSLSSSFFQMDITGSPSPPSNASSSFAFPMDVRNGFFILNPSGDLKKTQDQFEPWIKQMKEVGWDGIVGRVPSEGELLQALGSKDIVVYFGHGGGEQYIRSHKIRSLPRCATLMLWGCSSGALRDFGEFDRAGTPWNYMLAGCPSLVANLWDVTDRDIDRLSEAVFLDLDIQASSIRAGGSGKTMKKHKKGKTTAQAVGEARDKCKLRFLTGAAVVVYGVPVRFV